MTIQVNDLKLPVCDYNILSEGSMSRNLHLDLSLSFMSKNG